MLHQVDVVACRVAAPGRAVTRPRPVAIMPVAPTPAPMRARTKRPVLSASAQATFETTKTKAPRTKTRRRPHRSATTPAGRRVTARPTLIEARIHDSPAVVEPNSAARVTPLPSGPVYAVIARKVPVAMTLSVSG